VEKGVGGKWLGARVVLCNWSVRWLDGWWRGRVVQQHGGSEDSSGIDRSVVTPSSRCGQFHPDSVLRVSPNILPPRVVLRWNACHEFNYPLPYDGIGLHGFPSTTEWPLGARLAPPREVRAICFVCLRQNRIPRLVPPRFQCPLLQLPYAVGW